MLRKISKLIPDAVILYTRYITNNYYHNFVTNL